MIKSISKIETAILSALEQTPPELYADIVVKGIWLAGGGALLKGLDKRLSDVNTSKNAKTFDSGWAVRYSLVDFG